jgi:hypothetical protein
MLYSDFSIIVRNHLGVRYGIKKIILIESNAKMSSSKKVIWKGTLRQVFICLKPLPLLGFCLGVVEQYLYRVYLAAKNAYILEVIKCFFSCYQFWMTCITTKENDLLREVEDKAKASQL